MVTKPVRHVNNRHYIPQNLDVYLNKVKICNSGQQLLQTYTKFYVDGVKLGYINPMIEDDLHEFPQIFEMDQLSDTNEHILKINQNLITPDDRTEAFKRVTENLKQKGKIQGWRNELIIVRPSFHEPPKFLIERAALVHFGLKGYGIHVNGYVVNEKGKMEMWLAKRSKSKTTFPGKLDHIAAGAVPYGINCQTNVLKECREEANIPGDLTQKAFPVGAVTSVQLLPHGGLGRDVLFVYDLPLPKNFKPNPVDGEVEQFMKVPIEEVAQIVATTNDFKNNCNIVLIDFLIRHGYLTPDQLGYLELLNALRGDDCS